MRVVTWNVNSVRLRLDLIDRMVSVLDPDYVCLQEIKVATESFPSDAISEIGFPHQAVRGMKGYNGVAILSRTPIGNSIGRDWCGREDARHVAATVAEDIELHNFYVPAGGDEPDPEINHKFAHKLAFLAEAASWSGELPPLGKQILVGDLNIAPLKTDVWSHRQLLKVVSHTPVEVDGLAKWREAYGWVDAVRLAIPAEEKLFSWWSYRNRTWPGSNRGRRLDHIWVSPALVNCVSAAGILAEARGWDNPSDHAPVWADFSV